MPDGLRKAVGLMVYPDQRVSLFETGLPGQAAMSSFPVYFGIFET